MRVVGFIAAASTFALTLPVCAQDFDASGPTGPRTSRNDAQAEIERLKGIIRELEREISRLRQDAAAPDATPEKGDLIGTWLGSVACGRRQFSITFSVNEQFGRVAKGKWEFSGAAKGTDEAQISPAPTSDTPDTYTIVTAQPGTFDYVVQLEANTMSGKSTRQNCQIRLERG